MLSWNMDLKSDVHADVASYQVYAYQEGTNPSSWKKVVDVKALPLPMACTLAHLQPGHRYHFAVRAVDIHGRLGSLSDSKNVVFI